MPSTHGLDSNSFNINAFAYSTLTGFAVKPFCYVCFPEPDKLPQLDMRNVPSMRPLVDRGLSDAQVLRDFDWCEKSVSHFSSEGPREPQTLPSISCELLRDKVALGLSNLTCAP